MEEDRKTQLLKVVVGSQAHGLADKKSDWDYRGVFVYPTKDILSLWGGGKKDTSWIEGNVDDTSWEIGKFLQMATKCNPTVLETFLAPIDEKWMRSMERTIQGRKMIRLAEELQALFPYVWNSTDVMNAFIGYGLNQRKKFLEDKDNRAEKYAAAFLRVLYNAYELLTTGRFTVRIADTEVGETVRRFKAGDFTRGEVIEVCYLWETRVQKAYRGSEKHETNEEKVNDFLLKIRKEFWNVS